MPSVCSETQNSAVAVFGIIFVVEIEQKQAICVRVLLCVSSGARFRKEVK